MSKSTEPTLYPHGDPVVTRPGTLPPKREFISASRREIDSLLSEQVHESREATDGQ